MSQIPLFAGILQAPETSSKLPHCLHTAEVAGSIGHRPLSKSLTLQVELRTSLKGYRRDEKGLHRYVHGATVANEEDAKQIATEAGLEGFLLSWMNQGDGNMHARKQV